MIPKSVLDAYQLHGPAIPLGSGTVQVARVGGVVIKPVHDGSLEHPRSLDVLAWLADQIADIEADGFRLARPIRSQEGAWLVADKHSTVWSAWTFLPGQPMKEHDDIPAVIEAIYALHRALHPISRLALLDENDTPWGVADRCCWDQPPAWIHPVIEPLALQLYERLRPIPDLPCQIIHSDLNLANIIVAPELPPGFIDITPVWAPVDFTVAMFANWLGPRRGDVSRLRYFEHVPHFDQLLLRAAIRMLLIVSELHGVDEWREEQRAAELVLAYVG